MLLLLCLLLLLSQYLPHADLVVVMLDGRIAHTGQY